MQYIGIGFDAISWSAQGRSPVLQLRYSDNNKNPFVDHDGTKYAVPDGVSWSFDSGTDTTVKHTVVRDVQTLIDEQLSQAGISAGIPGMFTASVATSKASGTVRSGQQIYTESLQRITIWELNCGSPSQLEPDPTFLSEALKLPTYDSSNPNVVASYEHFFGYYGTHYVRSAQVGGEATMSSAVTEAYSSSHNDVSIKVQVGVSWNSLNAGGQASTEKQHSDEYISSKSESSMEVRGGDPRFHAGWEQTQNWQEWVESVQERPAVIQYKIESLSKMVAGRDAAKAANLDEAVTDYITKHAKTWPDADPTSYTIGTCDCQWVKPRDYISGYFDGCTYNQGGWACAKLGCQSLGEDYFIKNIMAYPKSNTDGYLPIRNDDNTLGTHGVECCRACYK
ncbi:hypothetical protein TrRE_jg63 [Triparma retinervis]|uniref:MACPF domain-containing protein n=1 Tax=Triparma retinervis TaxID=2557542 RepID=A0A9W6ZCQ2_9STRA|nr:hypothetical protein TrRE_jg63 [Triparma retinervis]